MRIQWRREPRWHDQRGAALVEFSLVVVLFFTLLYGLVAYGLMLALKQSVTNAANEGARAAIGGSIQDSYATASSGLGWLGTKCCRSDITALTPQTTNAPLVINPVQALCPGAALGGSECVTVSVSYDFKDSPLLPPLPGFGLAFPDTIASTGVIQLPPPPVP
ncbi:MAG: pilus assembly protein [Actinomycetota bacterium]|jgi:Flp pilus assembly pilin Flp|nr:pilus assembly protein [Actinomycetota bacterium]